MGSLAAAIAANDDLISEILSWLPSRSVVRFKIVCKRWLCLISDPIFITTHTRRKRCPVSGFILHYNSYNEEKYNTCSLDDLSTLLPDPSLSFIQHRLCPDASLLSARPASKFRIWNCCNGLVLCSEQVQPSCTFPRTEVFISCVSNPTTMACKEIPLPTAPYVLGAGLAFDPSRSPHYRVICLGAINNMSFFFGERKYDIEFEMYCSETGTWESCGRSSLSGNVYCRNGVYWNGAMNWVTVEGSLNSFDVERRQLLQATSGFRGNILYFGESGGHLHLIGTDDTAGRRYDVAATCFDIMEMPRDRSGWYRLYCVDLAVMEHLYPGIYIEKKLLDLWPVFVCRGEAEDDDELVMSMPTMIVAYSLRNKTFRLICTVPPMDMLGRGGRQALTARDVIPYAHSLAPL